MPSSKPSFRHSSSGRPSRSYPEWAQQKALIDLVNMHSERYPVLQGLFHPANEGNRTQAQTGMLIAAGMRPGVSDLILPRGRRGWFGLAMEMKAPGKLKAVTPEQRDFLKQQWAEGWLAFVCDDAAAGWEVLHWYAKGERGKDSFDEVSYDSRHIVMACNL